MGRQSTRCGCVGLSLFDYVTSSAAIDFCLPTLHFEKDYMCRDYNFAIAQSWNLWNTDISTVLSTQVPPKMVVSCRHERLSLSLSVANQDSSPRQPAKDSEAIYSAGRIKPISFTVILKIQV